MHLGGEDHGPVPGDFEAVRGTALRSGRRAGPGVDPDQPQRLQLGGDSARRGPGHTQFRGEHGPGRGATGVHELQCGPERTAPPVQPRP